MDITVTRKERKPAHLALSKPKDATYVDSVWVQIGGKTKLEMGFTRYENEEDWLLDSQFSNSLPVFNHGEGSRCCIKKKAQGALLDAIEKTELNDIRQPI
jgi:hypothetical protein